MQEEEFINMRTSEFQLSTLSVTVGNCHDFEWGKTPYGVQTVSTWDSQQTRKANIQLQHTKKFTI